MNVLYSKYIMIKKKLLTIAWVSEYTGADVAEDTIHRNIAAIRHLLLEDIPSKNDEVPSLYEAIFSIRSENYYKQLIWVQRYVLVIIDNKLTGNKLINSFERLLYLEIHIISICHYI